MGKHKNVVKAMIDTNRAAMGQAVLIEAGALGFAALDESAKKLPAVLQDALKHPLMRLFIANVVTVAAEKYNLDSGGHMSAALNSKAMHDVADLIGSKVLASMKSAVESCVESDPMPLEGQVVTARQEILNGRGQSPKFSDAAHGSKGKQPVSTVFSDTPASKAAEPTPDSGGYRPKKVGDLIRLPNGRYKCCSCNGDNKQSKFATAPSGDYKDCLICPVCMKHIIDAALEEKKASEAATKAVEQARKNEARLNEIKEEVAKLEKKLQIEIDKDASLDEPKEFLGITNAKIEKLNAELISLLDEQKALIESGNGEVKTSPVPASKPAQSNAIKNIKDQLRK
jgi:hypothetical protein